MRRDERRRHPRGLRRGHYFAVMGNVARPLDEAGADDLVLLHRFHRPASIRSRRKWGPT